jgi:hypothetical protein
MQHSLNGARLLPSDAVAFTNPLGRNVMSFKWRDAALAKGSSKAKSRTKKKASSEESVGH